MAAICIAILAFTSLSIHYQRFYMPTSFFCTFLICLVTLLIFSSIDPFMGPLASMATSIQVGFLITAKKKFRDMSKSNFTDYFY